MEPRVLTVKQFNEFVNTALLEVVGEVRVSGEISGYKAWQGKMAFFSLKDADAGTDCSIFLHQLDFPIEDGQSVIVSGTPQVRVANGRFGLQVKSLQLQGEGELKRAFEALKAKLEAEGLFAPEHKQPTPRFPETIGIITSGDGAAVTDIQKVVNNRWGGLKLYLASVRVQGGDAPDQLVAAVEYFNRRHPVDVIIFGRGGGSLEDLQSFNSERVARAIFASRIPIVAGIGHERDVSIADFVADVRAATPSHAAEQTVPDRREVQQSVDLNRQQLLRMIEAKQSTARQTIERARHRLSQQIAHRFTDIRALISRLRQTNRLFAERRRQSIDAIRRSRQLLAASLQRRIDDRHQQIKQLSQLLTTLNPDRVLARGYSITMTSEGQPITRLQHVPAHGRIKTRLADGEFTSTVGADPVALGQPRRVTRPTQSADRLQLPMELPYES